MDADTAIPAVMPSILGIVKLEGSTQERVARLHRNGQVTYRSSHGNWTGPVVPQVAYTFAASAWGRCEIQAAEEAAYAEVPDVTTLTLTGAELNLIVTALAEMHAKANDWEGQYGADETAAYYTAPAPVQALMTKIANA